MHTKLIQIDSANIDRNAIKEAADLIAAGELVAFPTETVYGLGADALSPEASKKIYAAKGRPSDNPLIVHISKFEDLVAIAREVPPQAKKLADAFWPGPLTMIVWKNEKVPCETTGGMDTVAVRMPNHPVALRLIEESGCLIAAPSANTSGKPSPTEASHVALDMDGRIPMILDGGPVGIGIESTIIDLSEKTPMILRPGYITKEMLEETNSLAAKKQEAGLRVGVIATDETCDRYQADLVFSIGAREDEDAIARHLYKLLREFDDQNVDAIYSESFATPRIGQAIMNRLLKAAGHQVIQI